MPDSLATAGPALALPLLGGLPAAVLPAVRREMALTPASTRGAGLRDSVMWLPLAVFAILLGSFLPQGAEAQVSSWRDVCTVEDYVTYKDQLCPEAFSVSTLAFNPLAPKAEATMTLILRPTKDLPSKESKMQYVHIRLPGFEPVGAVNSLNAMRRDLTITATNPTAVNENTATAYNTYLNPVFRSPATYQIDTGILVLEVIPGKSLRFDKFMEATICCYRLPAYSPLDNPAYRISAPTSLGAEHISIDDESILSTSHIDPGFQWDFLQVNFDPPVALALAVIELTIRSANDLGDRCRIILHTPLVTRMPPVNADIGFNTNASSDPNDWMYFAHLARWDNGKRTITFFLRENKVLPKGKLVTLRTNPGEFRLPTHVASNWNNLTVEARSSDGVDGIIQPTSVTQSARVPKLRAFLYSELVYYNTVPNARTHVHFSFRTNRPMFAGTRIYLRLSGFQAEVIEVALQGPIAHHFQNQIAKFDLPANRLEFHVNRTIFSVENNVTVTLLDLFLPPALYTNDESLLVWNSDPDCEIQSIEYSPEVGSGQKTFILSKVSFMPQEPRRAANITFTLRPTIVFYQGDRIVMHLYGFLGALRLVPLMGPGASLFKDGAAEWHPAHSALILEVAKNQIISNSNNLVVGIGVGSNFRLPGKLSKNDGILRIEGRGALITKEPIRKCPSIGGAKYVIDSRIVFEPYQPEVAESLARITFTLVLNTDVLPNSTIHITMGGILRQPPSCIGKGESHCANRTSEVLLSGKNAPLFVGGSGYWSQSDVTLTVKVVNSVQISSGELVRFFLERDQFFALPYAAYQNDPSFRLAIPEAGVPEQAFNYSTKVNQEPKTFQVSQIEYGGLVAYPNSVVEFQLTFWPTVTLPEGSIVRVTLPGFTSPLSAIPLAIKEKTDLSENYPAEVIKTAAWNQIAFTMDMVVPAKYIISRFKKSFVRILERDGFRLPQTPLLPNDPKLTIACIKNQLIFEEQIKSSPRVVDRTFLTSVLEYHPPQRESIFQLIMVLEPTVDIKLENEITIKLPGFRNKLSKRNVHLMGKGRSYFKDSLAAWDETASELKLTVKQDQTIKAFSTVRLRIEESQGFILPETLDANDSRILISSKNNIEPPEPFKVSPMVGNGPYSGHMICMYQYERGVRTPEPICTNAVGCNPPITDPCSREELQRCGCNPRLDQVFSFTVQGFNLQENDNLTFVPQSELCSAGRGATGVLSSFSTPTSKTVSQDRQRIQYHNIQATGTGYFRMCVMHQGKLFDVGRVVVRPSCRTPMVLSGGACVEYCPKNKIPIAGDCRLDALAMQHADNQALMIPVRMSVPSVAGLSLPDLATTDAERRYFIYRFTYELSRLLDCDAKRIVIASLSNGSVIVNTVFKAVEVAKGKDGEPRDDFQSSERTPRGLVSLFQALQRDQSSLMYNSPFFKHIDRDFVPVALPVRLCSDDTFRVFCPYSQSIQAVGTTSVIFVCLMLLFQCWCVCQCCVCWHIDRERGKAFSEEELARVRDNPQKVEPQLQIEYASSWLEGRFVGENWESARGKETLAIQG